MRGKLLGWGCAFTVVVTLWCSAGEKRHFAGTWEPPPGLLEFWAPIDDSWWNPKDNRRLIAYCQNYAKRSDPAKLLPDIMQDLRNEQSAEACLSREFVYFMLVTHWDKGVVARVLAPYTHSPDADTRELADDFISVLEDAKASSTPSQ
jgi:hypothetical protein